MNSLSCVKPWKVPYLSTQLPQHHTGKTILKTTLDTHAHLHVAPLERVIKAASKLAVSCVAGTSPNRLDETRGQQVHGHVDIVSSL